MHRKLGMTSATKTWESKYMGCITDWDRHFPLLHKRLEPTHVLILKISKGSGGSFVLDKEASG